MFNTLSIAAVFGLRFQEKNDRPGLAALNRLPQFALGKIDTLSFQFAHDIGDFFIFFDIALEVRVEQSSSRAARYCRPLVLRMAAMICAGVKCGSGWGIRDSHYVSLPRGPPGLGRPGRQGEEKRPTTRCVDRTRIVQSRIRACQARTYRGVLWGPYPRDGHGRSLQSWAALSAWFMAMPTTS